MGITRGTVSLLCESQADLRIEGKVLQLGKQGIYVDPVQLNRTLVKFGLPNYPMNAKEKVTDVDFFKALGFQSVESLDANAYEGADHIHDFNKPVPEHMKGQYDLIFDGGTLEHVFDFPQSLRNIFDMLKPGGIIIHGAPCHNYVDHGFYMFSPTLFHDYYAANKFKILKSYLFEYASAHTTKEWLIYNYTPGSIEHLSMGGWGKKLLGIFFVAQKGPLSTNSVTPQQGACIRDWSRVRAAENSATREASSGGLRRGVKRALTLPGIRAFSKIAHALNYRAYIFYLKRLKGKPRVIARY